MTAVVVKVAAALRNPERSPGDILAALAPAGAPGSPPGFACLCRLSLDPPILAYCAARQLGTLDAPDRPGRPPACHRRPGTPIAPVRCFAAAIIGGSRLSAPPGPLSWRCGRRVWVSGRSECTPTYLVKQALERSGRTSLLLGDAGRRLAKALEDRDHGER
jgi:hypothetical protein